MKRILILGGYGLTGSHLARFLHRFSDCKLILAGRQEHKARELARELETEAGAGRVRGIALDASSEQALVGVLGEVDLVVLATSSWRHAAPVAKAALASRTDYLDVQFSKQKLATLQAMAPDIEAADLCFVTEGGFHPGLPALLVRHAAAQLDPLKAAHVAAASNMGVEGEVPESVYEFIESFAEFECADFRGGGWSKSWLTRRPFDFGPGIGTKTCQSWRLEEMLSLPEMVPTLEQTGMYIAGMNWFVDYLAVPLILAVLPLAPRRGIKPLAALFLLGLKWFSRPPYYAALKLEAEGERAGVPGRLDLLLRHEDEYVMTAAPTVACLLQLLDGSARKPGLHFMAHLAEPGRLLEDVRRMGVTVHSRDG